MAKKSTELKGLGVAELNEKYVAETEALRKLKFAHKVSSIENPMKIKETRRTIARIKTELRAKELQK